MTTRREDEPVAAIEYSEVPADGYCDSCGRPFHPMVPGTADGASSAVRIVNIAQVKAGWLAHGDLQSEYCVACGKAYAALTHYIPIECAAFPCPSCGPDAALTTEILSISETEAGYGFVALLKCDACTKQRRLSRLLSGLSKITRVKVGPTGVEVEVKP